MGDRAPELSRSFHSGLGIFERLSPRPRLLFPSGVGSSFSNFLFSRYAILFLTSVRRDSFLLFFRPPSETSRWSAVESLTLTNFLSLLMFSFGLWKGKSIFHIGFLSPPSSPLKIAEAERRFFFSLTFSLRLFFFPRSSSGSFYLQIQFFDFRLFRKIG